MAIKKVFDLRFPFWSSIALNFIAIGIITFILLQENLVLTKYKTMIVEKVIEDIPLTDSAIISELTHLGCMQVPVALAQFKIETGHFTSHICKQNKNIAGIRTSRSKLVIGMKNDHCAYATYRDCLRDYVAIQNRYLTNINHRYAEDPNYIAKLKQIR
jgi:uncharacterized FlgJ-related protein